MIEGAIDRSSADRIGDGSRFIGLAVVRVDRRGLGCASRSWPEGRRMSVDQIVFTSSSDTVAEGSRLNVTAKFRDSIARTDQTPTTVDWSLRDPDSGREIVAATPLTPGTSVVVPTLSTHNLACRIDERREVTVVVDRNLATQFVATYLYQIRNIGAFSPS